MKKYIKNNQVPVKKSLYKKMHFSTLEIGISIIFMLLLIIHYHVFKCYIIASQGASRTHKQKHIVVMSHNTGKLF